MKYFPFIAMLAATSLALSDQGIGEELHPGIIGKDDRVLLEQQGAPWDAIGQVNITMVSAIAGCTGTLVAPDVVITAAHCVMDQVKLTPYPVNVIHFIAGVRGSDFLGHSTAKCLHFLKDYAYQSPQTHNMTLPEQLAPLAFFLRDAVAIVLQDAIDVDPAPLAGEIDAEPGLKLTHVAYPADHRYMPWVHFDCELLRVEPNMGLWFNSCDTHGGSTGGPIFVKEDGTYKLAAIMLGVSERLFNIAYPVSAWRELAGDHTCP